MPAAVGLVAAAAGYATTAAIGAGLLGSVAGFVVSTAINQIGGRALAKKPPRQDFSVSAQGFSATVRSPVESHKIVYGTARVSGPLVFVKSVDSGRNNFGTHDSGDNKFIHLVIPLAGHEVEEIGTVYVDDLPVTLDAGGFVQEEPFKRPASDSGSAGISFVRIKKHLGSADQSADDDLVSECGLGHDFRLRGIAYLYVRLHYNPNVFPGGLPQNYRAVVKGKKVYDPRTDTTAWSDNAALCIRDYLTADYGFGCAESEIDDDHFEAAANVCDESVTLSTGPTQARYTANGVADTAAAPLDNLQGLVTSLAGAVTYVQGKFRCHAAAYDAPAGALTASMLADGFELQARADRKDLFNAVRGTYVDPERRWQPTDFPMVTNATYEAQDGGERIAKDVELPFTTHPEAAQRIAKILLEKSRQGQLLELKLNHSALKYSAYDVVTFTDSQLGISAKAYRILRFALGVPGPLVAYLQEESSASYDWDNGQASIVDPAPDTTLPSPSSVAPPGNPSIAEALYSTRTGAGVKARATVSWTASTDPFVSRYQAEYKLASASEYAALPLTGSTSAEIADIAPGTYNFRVKAVNSLGASSPYAEGTPKEIFGLSARPAAVTGLNLQLVSSLAVLRWDPHADLDVTEGGKILIRHSEATSGATWEDSYSIAEEAGGARFCLAPLKAGTYLLKAQDSSGLTSADAASAATKNASVLSFSALSDVAEDPAFGGTHAGTVADGGTLKLAGQGLIDDVIDFDEIDDFDTGLNVNPSGTYTFASGTDNGAVARVRVESSLEVATVNALDRIDSRTGDMDDWLDFDGTAGGGSVDCWVEARETDDDPAGSPAWGDWRRVDAADFEAWGLQYRARLISNDPAFNIHVTRLRVNVKEVT